MPKTDRQHRADVAAFTGGGGTVPITSGGTGQTNKTAGMDALSPTSAKGDLFTDDGSNVIKLAVGADDTVLVADSAQSEGIKWSAALVSNTNQLIHVGASAPTGNEVLWLDTDAGSQGTLFVKGQAGDWNELIELA